MTVIALILPAGAAVLTIVNLQRLGAIDRRRARELTIATVVIFALGLSILLGLSLRGKTHGQPQLDSVTSALLSVGVAAAAYLAQRDRYRLWRAAHSRAQTGSWLTAIALAIVYTIVTIGVAVVVYIPLALIFNWSVAGTVHT